MSAQASGYPTQKCSLCGIPIPWGIAVRLNGIYPTQTVEHAHRCLTDEGRAWSKQLCISKGVKVDPVV